PRTRRCRTQARSPSYPRPLWPLAGGKSGRGARVATPVGVDVEGLGSPFRHLSVDDHFLDAFKAGEVEHGVQKDAFHNGSQATGARLASYGLLGHGPQRIF